MKFVRPYNQEISQSHHHACHTLSPGFKYEGDKGYVPLEKIQLQGLQVSRQIYQEANEVLYSTNTFSFDDPIPFRYFLEPRSPLQSRMIRKLRLRMDWTLADEMD
ncbi:MAG: hypothetical protein Q9183_004465, partial [Haloplaca sp. 2 TL-2023]